jgi:hypothetical protein
MRKDQRNRLVQLSSVKFTAFESYHQKTVYLEFSSSTNLRCYQQPIGIYFPVRPAYDANKFSLSHKTSICLSNCQALDTISFEHVWNHGVLQHVVSIFCSVSSGDLDGNVELSNAASLADESCTNRFLWSLRIF